MPQAACSVCLTSPQKHGDKDWAALFRLAEAIHRLELPSMVVLNITTLTRKAFLGKDVTIQGFLSN